MEPEILVCHRVLPVSVDMPNKKASPEGLGEPEKVPCTETPLFDRTS